MIVRATAHPAYLQPTLLRPRPGLAPLVPTAPDPRDFGDTGWVELDGLADDADAGELVAEADVADAALLRCVGCAAFATLVLALVSSLQMG